jgi:hypothetical protein
MYDETSPTPALEQLGLVAAAVAEDLLSDSAGESGVASGGSLHRGLPEELRARFIAVRRALFERGIYVPMLGRFDSATVPQASTQEIAAELAKAAASM